jgi:hypothetical protein
MTDNQMTFPNKEVKEMWPDLYTKIKKEVTDGDVSETLEARVRTLLKKMLPATKSSSTRSSDLPLTWTPTKCSIEFQLAAHITGRTTIRREKSRPLKVKMKSKLKKENGRAYY